MLTDADSGQKEEKKKLQQRAGKIQSITITELNLCHIHVIHVCAGTRLCQAKGITQRFRSVLVFSPISVLHSSA